MGGTCSRRFTSYLGIMDKKVVLSPTIAETLLPAKADDVLELDEVWSFVFRRSNKRWLWTAICRRTKQIVVAVVGDRRAETCHWHQIVTEMFIVTSNLSCII